MRTALGLGTKWKQVAKFKVIVQQYFYQLHGREDREIETWVYRFLDPATKAERYGIRNVDYPTGKAIVQRVYSSYVKNSTGGIYTVESDSKGDTSSEVSA